jgi:hypothetical protein
MIKLILNGSFRSGTIMLWKIMRDSNPGMLVFYEPLHSELFGYIRVSQRKNGLCILNIKYILMPDDVPKIEKICTQTLNATVG